MGHADDFVALADRKECGWLDGFVEDAIFQWLPKKFHNVGHPTAHIQAFQTEYSFMSIDLSPLTRAAG